MRKVTPHVRAKLTEWEGGMKLEAYQDSVGVWTIGVGHTGGVKKGDRITPEQGAALLAADLAKAEEAVDQSVKHLLTDNQFGALVSFAFNAGVSAFRSSTLLRLLNAGDYTSVPNQLKRWNKGTVNGKKVVLKGLTNRRAKEIALWSEA